MKLSELREQRGMSREELAVAVKTSYPNILRLESGAQQPRLDLAIRIAELFGVPVESIEWGKADDADDAGKERLAAAS